MDKLVLLWLVFKLVTMFIGDHTGTAKKKKWEKSKHFIEVIIDDEHYMVEIIKPKKEKKK